MNLFGWFRKKEEVKKDSSLTKFVIKMGEEKRKREQENNALQKDVNYDLAYTHYQSIERRRNSKIRKILKRMFKHYHSIISQHKSVMTGLPRDKQKSYIRQYLSSFEFRIGSSLEPFSLDDCEMVETEEDEYEIIILTVEDCKAIEAIWQRKGWQKVSNWFDEEKNETVFRVSEYNREQDQDLQAKLKKAQEKKDEADRLAKSQSKPKTIPVKPQELKKTSGKE